MLRVLVGSLMCIGLVNNCYSLLSVSDAMDAKKQSTNTGFQSLCDDYIKLIQAHNNLHNRLSGAQGINGTATPLEGKAMKEIAAWDAACTSFTGPLATVTAPYVPQAHTQIINDIYLHAWTEYQRAGAGSAVANASGSQALPFPKSSTQPTISLSAPKPPPPPSGKNGLGTANLNVKTLPAPVLK